jgi:hypothetical protein
VHTLTSPRPAASQHDLILGGAAFQRLVGAAIGAVASIALLLNTPNFSLNVGSPVGMTVQHPLSLQQDGVVTSIRDAEQHPAPQQPISPRPQPLPPCPTVPTPAPAILPALPVRQTSTFPEPQSSATRPRLLPSTFPASPHSAPLPLKGRLSSRAGVLGDAITARSPRFLINPPRGEFSSISLPRYTLNVRSLITRH